MKSDSYYPEGTDLRYVDITHERERELFAEAKSGNAGAREFLIKNHLLFALNVGRGWAKGKLPEDEVASAANYALMCAIDRFDLSWPNRFTPYLRLFIRREMVNLWRSKNVVDQPEFEVGQENSNGVMLDVVAPIPGQPTRAYTVGTQRQLVPEHPDAVPSSADHPTESDDHAGFILRLLAQSKGCLTEQEAEVIRRHFSEDPESLDAIGKEWRVSRAWVSKIKLTALAKLKKDMRSRMESAGVTR